jgi:hypothetical protein
MEKEVDVRIDETGHEGGVAEIDGGGSGGMGDVGASLGDAVATDENFAWSDESAVLNVKQMGSAQDYYLRRGLGDEELGDKRDDECGEELAFHGANGSTGTARSTLLAEANDLAAVVFGGASWREDLPLVLGFAFGGGLFAALNALLGFTIESLRNGGGTADVAEVENFDFEFAAIVGDSEAGSDVDFASGLGGLSVELNSAEFTRLGGERAGFEEARCPEPFVDAYGSHDSFSYRGRV